MVLGPKERKETSFGQHSLLLITVLEVTYSLLYIIAAMELLFSLFCTIPFRLHLVEVKKELLISLMSGLCIA